jgi:hypothetical protein
MAGGMGIGMVGDDSVEWGRAPTAVKEDCGIRIIFCPVAMLLWKLLKISAFFDGGF